MEKSGQTLQINHFLTSVVYWTDSNKLYLTRSRVIWESLVQFGRKLWRSWRVCGSVFRSMSLLRIVHPCSKSSCGDITLKLWTWCYTTRNRSLSPRGNDKSRNLSLCNIIKKPAIVSTRDPCNSWNFDVEILALTKEEKIEDKLEPSERSIIRW